MAANDLRKCAAAYVSAFGQRDLATLGEIFDEGVTLRDWSIEAKGKSAVLEAARTIFSATRSLQIDVTKMVVDTEARTVVAELDVVFDASEHLRIVDLLEFSPEGLLSAIRAYKG